MYFCQLLPRCVVEHDQLIVIIIIANHGSTYHNVLAACKSNQIIEMPSILGTRLGMDISY